MGEVFDAVARNNGARAGGFVGGAQAPGAAGYPCRQDIVRSGPGSSRTGRRQPRDW